MAKPIVCKLSTTVIWILEPIFPELKSALIVRPKDDFETDTEDVVQGAEISNE